MFAAGRSADAARDAMITVHPDTVIGAVNPLVFGNNQLTNPESEYYSNRGAGIWSPGAVLPAPSGPRPVSEFVELSRQAGITVNRWPNVKVYDWKQYVGPVKDRMRKQFGLPEFLAFCEDTNAVPLITLSVAGTEPADAADLVEYLNQPNDGANPNGGTDWAAVRAADGHPKPYNVVWFEYGNEEYGSTPKTKSNPDPLLVSPEEYATRYVRVQAAMKALDPRVRLGAILQYGEWTWTRSVLEGCGRQMDFAIEHTYVPNYKENDDSIDRSLIAKACTASDTQIQERYDWLHSQIQEITGRKDVLLAITEYNGHFVQEQPMPYRQTLADALRNAEHLRVMMKPENRILMANFWQFANEYWGMVQGYTHEGRVPVRQANFYVYQLYHEHFGDALIKADVRSGTWDFAGAAGVRERRGQPRPFRLWEQNLLPADYRWDGKILAGSIDHRIDGRIATAEFNGEDVNYHHAYLKLPAEPSTGYRIVGSIKTEGLVEKEGVTFEILDGRGWGATHSNAMGTKVKGTEDWTRVQVDYVTLPDAKEIQILARRLGGNGPVRGKASFRLEAVRKFLPANAGAVPDVGVNSAKRPDGTVTVIIVNKNTEESIPVHLSVAGARPRKHAADAWMLTGASCFENNLSDPSAVGIRKVAVGVSPDGYSLQLPPCSMAACEIRP